MKLRPQMVLVLDLLLARQGQVVTRDELRRMLWPDERIVMFEGSIYCAVRFGSCYRLESTPGQAISETRVQC